MTTEQLFGERMWVLSTKITSPFCSVVCQLSLSPTTSTSFCAPWTVRHGIDMLVRRQRDATELWCKRWLQGLSATSVLEWASPFHRWVQAQLQACERKRGSPRSLHQQGQTGQSTWRRSRDHLGFEAAEMEVKIYEGWQWLTTQPRWHMERNWTLGCSAGLTQSTARQAETLKI